MAAHLHPLPIRSPALVGSLFAMAALVVPIVVDQDVAALHAADPFDIVSFESGWKQVARTAVTGVASDGKRTVVAWGGRGYVTSADGGLTWSQPVMVSTGAVGAAGSQPVEIADAIVTSTGVIWMRTVAGAVVRVGGPDPAPIQGIEGMAVQMIGVDGSGNLYCEGGGVVIAVDGAGRRVGQQAGRIVGVVREAAVVVDQAGTVWRLDGADGAARRVAVGGGVDARNLWGAVRQASPPTSASFVDAAGGIWTLSGDKLISGGVPAGLEVRCIGGFDQTVAGVRLTGIGVAVDRGTQVLIGMDEGGRLHRLPDAIAAGVDAVAPVAVPDGARWRLVGVGAQAGIVMYRSGL
jgi:hypothetical protein